VIGRPFAVSWFGRERRSNDAIHQLARRHYTLCRNAADPFELAAQLESLGYNRYRVKREFGLRNTFELAERLFALTPRRPRLIVAPPKVASPFWWQFATLVALTLSLLLYSAATITPNDGMFAWLLVWTMTGHYLTNNLETADFNTKKRIFTLLLVVGFVGLAITLYAVRATFLEAAIGLLWWQLPATFWLSTFAPRQRLRPLVVSILAGFAFFIPPLASLGLLLCAALLLFAPFLARPRATTFQYLSHRWHAAAFPALLGLGQSILLLHLFSNAEHPLAGLALIVITVLAASWLETSFKRSVARALWRTKSREELRANLFRSLSFFLRLLIIILFLGLLALFNLLLPLYSTSLLPFMVLAFALAFSLLLLGFGDVFLPATGFIIASLLVLAGIPFLGVVTALTAILALGVVLYITKVERYGVDLL
jgi:hypothetical protein